MNALKSGMFCIFRWFYRFIVHNKTHPYSFSNKVDVWSIGVIFYQMLFGKRPFGDGLSQDKVLSNSLILKAKEVRFPKTPQVSERSQQFIQSCLTYEQHDRPTIAELCKHPYITETKESETVSIF
jgi:tousled-like kinase